MLLREIFKNTGPHGLMYNELVCDVVETYIELSQLRKVCTHLNTQTNVMFPYKCKITNYQNQIKADSVSHMNFDILIVEMIC